jgi:adenylate cyclase
MPPMAETSVQRRLAAILAADVVGYSRLMGLDEQGTRARFKAEFEDVIVPAVEECGGRIVKTMGDGFLVEYGSIVEAVRCSMEIQDRLVERQKSRQEDQKIRLRIGVHVGDVIIEDDDIHGDGVNIAARLESLAEPEGICISRAAFEQVRDKLPFPFVDCGEHALKNISRPIHVYRISGGSVPKAPGRITRPASRRRRTVAAIAAALIVAVAGAWFGLQHFISGSSAGPPNLGTPRLSIAVLPFVNLSGDESQNYFADALTDDITSDLSRISGSFVISRSSAATYRDHRIDAKRVADELNVRYLLEGTVRRSMTGVLVTAALTDGKTGQQLWSERYEKSGGDIYTFQNEVTGRVARALNLELKEAVSRQVWRRGSGNLDSIDLALRAWAEIWNKPQSPATNRAGLEYANRALELNPNNAEALGVATYAYARAATYGWDMSRAEAIRKGLEAGERSLALDPDNADAVYGLGFIQYAAGATIKSLELMRRVIELNRNHAPAYFFTGINLIRLGKPREAIEWVERAFRLSPRDPLRSVWYATIGRAQVLLNEDKKAIETAQKGIVANSNHPHNYAVLASAYAHLGEMDKATAALDELKRVLPNATVGGYLSRMAGNEPVAINSYKRFVAGLRSAGLAE